MEEAIKIARLEYSNIVSTHSFAKKHNIPCESRPCNTVDVVYDQESYAIGIESIDLMRKEMGNDDPAVEYRVYGPDEARKRFLCEGTCQGESVRGAFEYMGGSISAYKFAVGVLKLALKKGLNLQTHTSVTSIEAAGSALSEGAKNVRWLVQTPRGVVQTSNLIIATNGYTPHLLPEFQSKIVPLRGQITAQRPGALLKELAPNGLDVTYSFIYSNGYEYMVQRPYNHKDVPEGTAGDIIIGGGLAKLPQEGLDEFGECDDTVLNKQNSQYLKETLVGYFGKTWGEDDTAGRVRKEWTGIMGIPADGVPFVGAMPSQQSGLWVSAGFNGHGRQFFLNWSNPPN